MVNSAFLHGYRRGSKAGRSPARSRSAAARRPRRVVVVAELPRRRLRRPRRMRALCPLRRDPGGVAAAIEAMQRAFAAGLTATELADRDAAWRRAQRARLRVLGSRGQARRQARPCDSPALPPPQPLVTAYTISLGSPDAMAGGCRNARRSVRCSRSSSAARAIRSASPPCATPRRRRNSSSTPTKAGAPQNLDGQSCAPARKPACTLIEQPLPAGADDALAGIARPVAGLRRRKRA